MKQPSLPLPPPLMMNVPGSFAHYTLTQRWTAIVDRILRENAYPAETVTRLEALRQELLHGTVRSLRDDGGPDLADWTGYLAPFVGKAWTDVPWFFAEVYFYRRILEATDYFRAGEWQGHDPFAQQKQAGLEAAIPATRILCEAEGTDLPTRLYGVLWGNRADLSLRPTETASAVQGQTQGQQQHILVDDTPRIGDRRYHQRIDVIADNAGFELVTDLFLIEALLADDRRVHLHLKAHPTFVSDATIADVRLTLAALSADASVPVQQFARRLESAIVANQLVLQADPFWTAPLSFWEMPEALHTDLAASDLVIIKGDAHYRRLLGDRQWEFTTLFADVVGYFPTAFVALRTLKSEIVIGLSAETIQWVSQTDPDWLTNGKWGVIQAFSG